MKFLAATLISVAALFSNDSGVEASMQTPYYNRAPFAGLNTGFTRRQNWYSPYQQYSPPQKPYLPTSSRAIFATCKAMYGNGQNEIQIAQMPGQAPIVNYTVDLSPVIGDQKINFRIHEYGAQIFDNGDVNVNANACDNVGDEFNPLKEFDASGNVNTFQDPNYGRLPSVNVLQNMGGDYSSSTPISFLANLEGRHSIIGRSIVVSYDPDLSNDVEEFTVLYCCPIVAEATPAGFSTQVARLEEQYNIQHAASFTTNVAVPNNRSGSYGSTQAASTSSQKISTSGGNITINL